MSCHRGVLLASPGPYDITISLCETGVVDSLLHADCHYNSSAVNQVGMYYSITFTLSEVPHLHLTAESEEATSQERVSSGQRTGAL